MSEAYIVAHINGELYGVGSTKEQAWKDALRLLKHAGVQLLEENEEPDGDRFWVRISELTTYAATQELADRVKKEGGGVAWSIQDGVASSRSEGSAQTAWKTEVCSSLSEKTAQEWDDSVELGLAQVKLGLVIDGTDIKAWLERFKTDIHAPAPMVSAERMVAARKTLGLPEDAPIENADVLSWYQSQSQDKASLQMGVFRLNQEEIGDGF
jgi:hypothetical protein